MSTESVEKRLQQLEDTFNKKVASLELEVERAKAVSQIQNLINRMQYLHGAGRDFDIADKIFAQKAPNTRLHFGEQGYWEGIEGIRIIGNMSPPESPESRAGRMAMHLMLQPVIEVAGDGQTAKAVFWAMGLLAGKDRQTGEPSATWEWNRYHDDFIKEDGEWKLWHHHVYPLFRIGYDEKWADQFKEKETPVMEFPEETKQYYHPPTPDDVFYRPDEVLPNISYPEPYETWDPEKSF